MRKRQPINKNELIHNVLRLNRMVGQRAGRWGTSNKAGQLQYATLLFIQPKPATVGAVSQYLDISKPSMAQLLNRMQREGFLRRKVVGHDRRSVLVSITESGQKELNRMIRLRDVQVKKLFKGVTPGQLQIMNQALSMMYRNLAHHLP